MLTLGISVGMVLLAELCVSTLVVIKNGQILIGGLIVLVCRNYFGSHQRNSGGANNIPFPNVDLVDNDEEGVGPMVLHGID